MTPDRLSSTLAALADPTRRAILSRLASGEATVMELAAPFSMTLPAISRHLKVLRNAGLITRGREAQWRPCRLEVAPFKEVADYVDQYRRLWEERLSRLDDYLREVQTKQTDDVNRTAPLNANPTSRANRATAKTSRTRTLTTAMRTKPATAKKPKGST